MKKRFLACLLALAMLASLCLVPAYAANAEGLTSVAMKKVGSNNVISVVVDTDVLISGGTVTVAYIDKAIWEDTANGMGTAAKLALGKTNGDWENIMGSTVQFTYAEATSGTPKAITLPTGLAETTAAGDGTLVTMANGDVVMFGWTSATTVDGGYQENRFAEAEVTITGGFAPGEKETLAASDFTLGSDKGYNGSAQSPDITLPTGVVASDVTIKYDGSTTTPTNAGTYAITIDVQETATYKAATGLSLGDWKINPATFTGKPSITVQGGGSAILGSVLNAVTTGITPNDGTFAYQWKRNGTAITSATGNTYTVTADDVGKGITVEVTATKANYTTATLASDAMTPGKATPGTLTLGAVENTDGKTSTGTVAFTAPTSGSGSYEYSTNGTSAAGNATVSGGKFTGLANGQYWFRVKENSSYAAGSWVKAGYVNSVYDITFNANGGTGNIADTTVTTNGSATVSYTLPAITGMNPPAGKKFSGWATSASGSAIGSATYSVSQDITLYAIWVDGSQVTLQNGIGYKDTVVLGDTDGSVVQKVVETDYHGTLSYAVTTGDDVIEVNAATGAITTKRAGTAKVTVIAPANGDYKATTKVITVTVNAPATVPGKPTNVAASGNGKLNVTWKAPANDGGSPITGYKVTVQPADGSGTPETKTVTMPAALNAAFDGLTNGTKYTVTVVATNAVGDSEAASIEATPAEPPAGGGGGGGSASVKVTFDVGENGTLIGKNEVSVTEGGKLIARQVPSVSANSGWKFLGWSADGKTAVDPTTVKIDKAMTFTALYEREAGNTGFRNDYTKPYMFGYPSGRFEFRKGITRAEVATIVARTILPEFDENSNEMPSYSDLQGGHWANKYIAYLEDLEVLTGYPDGTFKPNQVITRAEFVAIIGRVEGLTEGSNPYKDVEDLYWATPYIESASACGYVNGYSDGTFRPRQYITRAEGAKIMNAVLGWTGAAPADAMRFPDVYQGYWAYDEIRRASTGILVEE